MKGIRLFCLTDKLMVITYQFIRLNLMNNIFTIKFYKQCAITHYLSLVAFIITFSGFKGLCLLSCEPWEVSMVTDSGLGVFFALPICCGHKGAIFHALPCSSCLDIVALKRVLLLGFLTFPIHHPCWLSLSMDLMGFCALLQSKDLLLYYYYYYYYFLMLLLCGTFC
jgi:hypothetical protein